MPLTGLQHKQIQDALIAAFGDEDNLRQMLKFQMNIDLESVAKPGNMAQRTFDVVTWADEHGRVSDLIQGAVKQNPRNPDLQSLYEAAKSWHIEAAAPAETTPYKGLAFYDRADTALFFGREKMTTQLVTYLKDHHCLAVVGASGSGKSSVVRAGVVPALQKGEAINDSDKWAVYVVTPTARPLLTLAASLTQDSESVTAQATLIDDMGKDPRSLDLFASQLFAKTGAPRLLLVVDQFEELFTLCKDHAEQQAYVDNLLGAAVPDGVTTVILTLRADFYAQCAHFDNLRLALQESQKYIGPMSQAELRAAIEEPAKQGGWDLEPGLTNRLLKDVADQPGSLPLLSHALLETWKRRSGRMLTLAGYEASGGVQGAIAHTADDLYGTLSPEQQAMVRNVFVRLTSLGEGAQDTRRRVPLNELVGGAQAPQMEMVLKRLEDARLVTAEKQQLPAADRAEQQMVYVDVAHEALIRQWPLLRGWLDDDREGLRVHRRLTEASQEWEALRHDSGSLFRGALLAQTAEWAKTHDGDLNDQERAFLGSSREQVETEKREREAARQRELANAKKVRNLLAVLLAVVGAALVLAIGGVWYVQGKNAELDQKNVLANEQLKAVEGERLFAQAKQFKADLRVSEAISSFQAAAAYPKLGIDVSTEISETLRYAAIRMVQQGEAILAATSPSGTLQALHQTSDIAIQPQYLKWAESVAPQTVGWTADMPSIRQQALISATALYSQALALNPPPDTPAYAWIGPGRFTMGSSDADPYAVDNEKPRETITLDRGFWIQRTEVTNEQYKRCVDTGACTRPNNAKWDKEQFAREPVTDADWRQAKTYADWVGARLPTEAQWEYACRSSDGRIYPWGSNPVSPQRANYADSGLNGPIDVGSYPAGVNSLYDMAGNVWEWTSSLWGDDPKKPAYGYPYKPDDGRENLNASDSVLRVSRGGAFPNNDYNVRCASRSYSNPVNRYYDLGFRVVTP